MSKWDELEQMAIVIADTSSAPVSIENKWLSRFTGEDVLALIAENERLSAEAERLRMQLAACGVVAMANTPESAATQRDMHPDYMSASCQGVMRAVDREMELRAEVEALRKDAERYRWLRSYAYGTMVDHEIGDLFSYNDEIIDEKVDELRREYGNG